MAAYAYKDAWGSVPSDFEKEWCDNHGLDIDELMEGEAYDWPQWSMMADYISYLESELED